MKRAMTKGQNRRGVGNGTIFRLGMDSVLMEYNGIIVS
jgi:hypothetical protein